MEEKLFDFFFFFLLSAFLVRDCDRKQQEDGQEVASSAAVTAELKADLLLVLKAVRKKQTNKQKIR